MPQEFQVLQCFNCQFFQVHIIKIVAKWSCKMCGEKQSVVKIFFKGTGKDCRLHVQDLNETRINRSEEINETIRTTPVDAVSIENQIQINPSVSKWSEYLTENSEDSVSSDLKTENVLKRPVLKPRNESFDTAHHLSKRIRTSKWDEFEGNIGTGDIKDSSCKNGTHQPTSSMFEPDCADLDSFLRFN